MRILSRFMVTLVVVTVVPLVAAQDVAVRPSIQARHLTGHLYLMPCTDNTYVVASAGPDGVLLVDTGFDATAEALAQALADLDAGPVRIIVNTHGDADHVGGNPSLGTSAVIIAHPAVRRQMGTYFALPALTDAGLPTMTVETPTTIHFNGEAVRLLPVPGGHTSGDMVVYFTDSGVACLGDIVLGGTFPNADPARGGDARRLAEVLREVDDALPDDVLLLPSHGTPMSTSGLRAYINMVEGTTAAVAAELTAGRELDEILERTPLTPWAEWERPDRRLSFDDWTREIHASLTGVATPSICRPLTEALVSGDVRDAVEVYGQLKTEQPDSWSFAENELNTLGYQLLAREMVEEAITIFELNVAAYPEASNPYDSLGEAHMVAGHHALAVSNYQRSLELDPGNTNAVAMLARLQDESR